MLDISPDKLVVVAAIAFMILGPNRVPGLARSLARYARPAPGHHEDPPAGGGSAHPRTRRALMDAIGEAPAAVGMPARIEPDPASAAVPTRLPDDAGLN